MEKRFYFTLTFMFIAGLGCASLQVTSQDWIPLFDGNSLDGWRANENTGSVTVQDGQIICDGPRSHLFYVGDVQNTNFKNFELKAEVMAAPGANSGIYFHTQFQDTGWPEKGYEVQINTSHLGAGNYRELKKTGSLYAVRNVFKSIVKDDEWYTMHIIVRGKRIMVRVNDVLLVDYVEPDTPVRSKSMTGRILSSGTFAIQCHDPDSRVAFRSILVKPLPDDLADSEPGRQPVVDDDYRLIARLNGQNFPIIDTHIHLKGALTLEDALTRSREVGIFYGIAANCGVGFPIENDDQLYEYLESMEGQPAFVAMQAEGREWIDTFSPEAIARFDYVFSDALTFTDNEGRRVQLWINNTVFIDDKQEFMEMYLDRIESVINDEPIDIFVNPTFLPRELADEYDKLWTGERMQRVIDAAVANNVAIEINARYRIPSATFIKQAKTSGAKFSFGTNNANERYGNLEYCLEMLRECELTANDMFKPGLKE
ncbi:family 16 glycoside hydrolase [Candidatus Neomarinimicrobiota bacterium]